MQVANRLINHLKVLYCASVSERKTPSCFYIHLLFWPVTSTSGNKHYTRLLVMFVHINELIGIFISIKSNTF